MKRLLSLFDHSGIWPNYFAYYGNWDVITVDIQDGFDLLRIKNMGDALDEFEHVDAIIAAPPCTDFSSSGAWTWKDKDKDGRTEASIELVRATLRLINAFTPTDLDYYDEPGNGFWWALENPVGRIAKLLPELGEPWYFHPYEFAGYNEHKPFSKEQQQRIDHLRATDYKAYTPDDVDFIQEMGLYTKKTGIWGDFVIPEKKPVEPIRAANQGSVLQRYGGKSLCTKNKRSKTPWGFAEAFFYANTDYTGQINVQDGFSINNSYTKGGNLINGVTLNGAVTTKNKTMKSVVSDVVYHGTDAAERFDKFRRKGSSGGYGVFFTDNPKTASSFAMKAGANNARVIPAHIDLKNPINLNDYQKLAATPQLRTAKAIELGYDGAYIDDYAGKVYLVFDPKRIRSSITGEQLGKVKSSITETAAFKRWFGDSKVVDEQGKPLVVYHGTGSDFDSFRKADNDIGIHLGTSGQANDRLAFLNLPYKNRKGMNVMPVFASIQNPAVLNSDPGTWDYYNLPFTLQQEGILSKEEARELESRYENEEVLLERDDEDNFVYPEKYEELRDQFTREAVQILEDKGYDGVKYWNTGEITGMAEIMEKMNEKGISSSTRTELYAEKDKLEKEGGDWSYIAFSPTQIKSATGNKGTFDPADPSILNGVEISPVSPATPMLSGSTDTPAFKRWFGDSKVVDEQGKPLVVYRGEYGTNVGPSTQLASITFAKSPETASLYAQSPNNSFDKAEAPKVFPVYLSIKNPIKNDEIDPFLDVSDLIDAIGHEKTIKLIKRPRIANALEDTNEWLDRINEDGDYATVIDYINSHPDDIGRLYGNIFVFLDDAFVVDALKAAGFDGAIHAGYGDNHDDVEYRVFSPTQIKSAIGNKGTYDPADPSILNGLDGKPKTELDRLITKRKEYNDMRDFAADAAINDGGAKIRKVEAEIEANEKAIAALQQPPPVDKPSITLPTFASELDRNRYIEKVIGNWTADRPATPAERELLLQYSGSGQSYGKRDDVSADAALYEFYTPDYIRDRMWKLAYHYGYDGGAVLEPSCSTAHMLLDAPDQSKCVGFEINPVTYKIAQVCFPEATFYNNAFETAFLDPFRGRYSKMLKGSKPTWLEQYPFSLVIGNPPYGKWQTDYPYFTQPLRGNFWQLEIFFLYQGLKLLKPGGLLVYLTASSWLRNGNSYQPMKKEVAKIATLMDAYRTGEVFQHTGVPTDILIYKRK